MQSISSQIEPALHADALELNRARAVMPEGILGFHKLMASSDYPSFLRRGDGAWVEDMEGRRYIDYVLGKGPVILGHNHPAVRDAVREQLDSGNLLSLTQTAQTDVAELLLTLLPGAGKVRFHKTGSEACAAAVRLARTFTGRRLVLSSGYHGWHDWCNPDDPGARGTADGFADFHYDLDLLERLLDAHRGDVAAIFVEPQPHYLLPQFYRELRSLADAASCVLILDEVKTGMRARGGTVQAGAGIEADLTTMSKAISNGFCVSAMLGRAELLDSSARTHISSTYDIEAIPFAAARATLTELLRGDRMEAIGQAGRRVADGLNELFATHHVAAKAFVAGSIFRIGFTDPDLEALFYRMMVGRGILMYPYDNHFVSAAHGEAEIAHTLERADAVLGELHGGLAPGASFEAVRDWSIRRFQNRKGFLAGVPSPTGRAGDAE